LPADGDIVEAIDRSEDASVESSNARPTEAFPASIDADKTPDELECGNNSAERPKDVPEKFWDSSTNSVRTDALLKSYLQLEKKLGSMVTLPTEDDPESRQRLQRALGRPDSPEDYQIEAPHELLSSDSEINAKLHDAGLTSDQAQLVYDLAAEHMLPIIENVNNEANQAQELSQLTAHFGGEQAWQAIAPQIKSWAAANLNEEVYEALGSSFDGIVAIHQMMQSREPNLISEAAVPSNDLDKDTLNQMMRDPKYWRDHDPAFVSRVTEGYKRIYG
jgi:hypothetical protein